MAFTPSMPNGHGGDATLVRQPELGIRGNTHFASSDQWAYASAMAARKTATKRPGRKAPSSEVAQFPPVPRVPPPPVFPGDPRQAQSARILGAIADVARSTMALSGPNLVKGFHASAVDLGRLQEAIERGLGRFSDEQIEARWPDLFRWIAAVIGAWVQRCKHMRIERAEHGVQIAIETQDDLGYYRYELGVFPESARAKRRC